MAMPVLEDGMLVTITNPQFEEFGWRGVLSIDEFDCYAIILPDETVLGVGPEDIESVYG